MCFFFFEHASPALLGPPPMASSNGLLTNHLQTAFLFTSDLQSLSLKPLLHPTDSPSSSVQIDLFQILQLNWPYSIAQTEIKHLTQSPKSILIDHLKHSPDSPCDLLLETSFMQSPSYNLLLAITPLQSPSFDLLVCPGETQTFDSLEN